MIDGGFLIIDENKLEKKIKELEDERTDIVFEINENQDTIKRLEKRRGNLNSRIDSLRLGKRYIKQNYYG
jgi:histone deacetylase complex regulatory component SIN3